MNIQTILYYNNIQTIETFGRDIYNGEINLKQDDNDQANLLVEVMDIPENKNKTRPQNSKKNVLKNLYALLEGREKVFDAFESKIFPIKNSGSGYLDFKPSNLKILTPKQMLERLPIALAQIKAGNNSESLLNEIRQIVYSLYQSKKNYQKST